MKIAIVGSGIAGLGAALALDPDHEVTLYERESRFGGHSRSVEVETPEGTAVVDTGFIVFNYENYPHLTAMFDHLGVGARKSSMSFAASIRNGWLEYGTKDILAFFSQRRNLLRPPFWGMLGDIMKFNRLALAYVDSNPDSTIDECIRELGLGAWFREYFLLAISCAVWSTPIKGMLEFPAATLVRFFGNHGLLRIHSQPKWYTVEGGSREYVGKIIASLRGEARSGAEVKSVERKPGGALVHDSAGKSTLYDQVVLACHSDQALKLIKRPAKAEAEILGKIKYQENLAVLHSDTAFMPRNRRTWASWVYLSESGDEEKPRLSYWMNRLQAMETSLPLIVSINPGRMPDPGLTHDMHSFQHPLFDRPAIEAQARMREIQGKDRIWFCGAWMRHGFHEDALASALEVAKSLGAEARWTKPPQG